MVFAYHNRAGETHVTITGDLFLHLFKTRRHKTETLLCLANLRDNYYYDYQILKLSAKYANVKLVKKRLVKDKCGKKLHIAWCIVQGAIIRNFLPYLNQLGVTKITFIYAERSQKNFDINLDKLRHLLIQSCMQCGRIKPMILATIPSIEAFIEAHPETLLLNFNAPAIKACSSDIKTVLIGPEGGLTKRECALFKSNKRISFETNYVLKSEIATLAIASKILL